MKKKVAIVFNRMTVGGAERALISLLNVFDTNRYDVTLFTFDHTGAFLDQVPSAIKIQYIHSIDLQHDLSNDIRHFRIRSIARGIYGRIMIRLHKDPYLKYTYSVCSHPPFDEQFHVAIAYKFGWEDSATVLYRIRAKKRYAFAHSTIDSNAPYDWRTAKYGKAMDAIFCVSQNVKAQMDSKYPKLKHKTFVLHNVVDAHQIERLSEASTNLHLAKTSLLTIGRLVDVKGQDMIPHAVRILLDQGKNVHWYIVGDGPLREKIEQEIRKHQVAEHVFLLGTKSNPYPYIKNCDIYVQTSYSEGWCLTTQEARILCKPIVTTNLPVMYEQFSNGVNGLIVEATPENLAEGISTLLDHPEICEKFQQELENDKFDNSAELQLLYDFIES